MDLGKKKLVILVIGFVKLCKMLNTTYINSFIFWGVNGQNLVIEFFVELDGLEVVKHGQQVGLDGVGVAGLTQDLQQGGVRHKEESGEQQTLLLKVSMGENNTASRQSFSSHSKKVKNVINIFIDLSLNQD